MRYLQTFRERERLGDQKERERVSERCSVRGRVNGLKGGDEGWLIIYKRRRARGKGKRYCVKFEA